MKKHINNALINVSQENVADFKSNIELAIAEKLKTKVEQQIKKTEETLFDKLKK